MTEADRELAERAGLADERLSQLAGVEEALAHAAALLDVGEDYRARGVVEGVVLIVRGVTGHVTTASAGGWSP